MEREKVLVGLDGKGEIMLLKNKKTGEIIDDGYVRETHDFQFDGQKHVLAVFKGNGHRPPERVSGAYTSLAELNEEWEDCQDRPFVIDMWEDGYICDVKFGVELEGIERAKECGLYFETREEAEKAVEKLKAWKRLKDKGFSFDPVDRYEALCGNGFNIPITATMPPEAYTDTEVSKDLDICFGGKE